MRNPESIKRVAAELQRSMEPTRPAFLKWICDKLSALPTQTSTGLNAALWGDNVIDVCAHYPEDLMQTATLELLRTKTFRPSPAEIVAVVEPRYAERKRMLERANSMLAPIVKAEAPFEREPLAVRLRSMRDSYRRHGYDAKAAATERELAQEEGRAVEDWATVEVSRETQPLRDNLPKLPPISAQAQASLNRALARTWRQQGHTARADALEAEAQRLAPIIDVTDFKPGDANAFSE